MRVRDRLAAWPGRAGRGDDGEFVAAEPRHQVVAAQRLGEALGHAADQLVADRVAERVVDVLEVIEIDVEHGGRRRAVAARFSIIASSRSPKKMRFGRPQSGSCSARWRSRVSPAAMVAAVRRMWRSTSAGQQREAAERDRDERDDAVEDLGARPLRRPGEAGDRSALLVGQIEDIVAGRGRAARRHCADCASCSREAISASTSSSMNLTLSTTGALGVHVGGGCRRRWRPRRRRRWRAGRETICRRRARCGRVPQAGRRRR